MTSEISGDKFRTQLCSGGWVGARANPEINYLGGWCDFYGGGAVEEAGTPHTPRRPPREDLGVLCERAPRVPRPPARRAEDNEHECPPLPAPRPPEVREVAPEWRKRISQAHASSHLPDPCLVLVHVFIGSRLRMSTPPKESLVLVLVGEKRKFTSNLFLRSNTTRTNDSLFQMGELQDKLQGVPKETCWSPQNAHAFAHASA